MAVPTPTVVPEFIRLQYKPLQVSCGEAHTASMSVDLTSTQEAVLFHHWGHYISCNIANLLRNVRNHESKNTIEYIDGMATLTSPNVNLYSPKLVHKNIFIASEFSSQSVESAISPSVKIKLYD